MSLLVSPAARAQELPAQPHRFTLGMRATVQQYDIRLGGYPFGRRRATVLPLQLVAAYQLSK